MLDVADREAFLYWLETNQDDLVDQLSQRPRPIKSWVADFSKALKTATAEMGADRGHAGIFSDSEEGMGLHDPDDDEEVEW